MFYVNIFWLILELLGAAVSNPEASNPRVQKPETCVEHKLRVRLDPENEIFEQRSESVKLAKGDRFYVSWEDHLPVEVWFGFWSYDQFEIYQQFAYYDSEIIQRSDQHSNRDKTAVSEVIWLSHLDMSGASQTITKATKPITVSAIIYPEHPNDKLDIPIVLGVCR